MADEEKHSGTQSNDSGAASANQSDSQSMGSEYGPDDLSIDGPQDAASESGAEEERVTKISATAASVSESDSDEEEGPSSVDPEEETLPASELARLLVGTKSSDVDPATSHSDEHIGHVAPFSLLVGVLVALILLTILTVGVTAVNLGAQGNFIVAMIIATVKAVLVMGYFMHLFWDSKFNVVVFCSSFLFAALFFSMALLDRQETQSAIDAYELDHPVHTSSAQ